MKKYLLILAFMPLFASVNIIFPDTSAAGGDTLIYPVYAQNVQPEDSIYGGQFWISISHPYLRPIQVFQGDITGDWGLAFIYDSTTYKLSIIMWGGTALRTDGIFFNIKFIVGNPETTTTVSIIVDSCYLIDEIANPVPLTVDTGFVVVTHVGIDEETFIPHPVNVLIGLENAIVTNNLAEPVKVYILAVNGRVEKKEKIVTRGTVSLKTLPAGVHFIVVENRERPLLMKKFVLIR